MHQKPQPTIREAIPRALLYFLLFWGLPGIVAGLIYGWELRHDEERTRIQGLHAVDLCASLIERTLGGARSDLLFLSRQESLRGFMERGRGKEALEREYVSFAGERGCYHDLRLLGADGTELVHLGREAGRPVIASRAGFQLEMPPHYFAAAWAKAGTLSRSSRTFRQRRPGRVRIGSWSVSCGWVRQPPSRSSSSPPT